MNAVRTWREGEELPEASFGPISRSTLALFAGGSGDHNPIHIDIDFARNAGAPDVFAHGMLSMAYLMQFATAHFGAVDLVSSSVRFLAITPIGAQVRCSGRIVEIREGVVRLVLSARIDDETETVRGEASFRVARTGLTA